jgi:hypothetical protein
VSIGGLRVQLSDLPAFPVQCPLTMPCVYRVNGMCGEPRINKGNGDAGCHNISNRVVLAALDPKAFTR